MTVKKLWSELCRCGGQTVHSSPCPQAVEVQLTMAQPVPKRRKWDVAGDAPVAPAPAAPAFQQAHAHHAAAMQPYMGIPGVSMNLAAFMNPAAAGGMPGMGTFAGAAAPPPAAAPVPLEDVVKRAQEAAAALVKPAVGGVASDHPWALF